MRGRWLRLLALLVSLSIVAAACDGDDDQDAADDGGATSTTETTGAPKQVDNLLIGQIWAETGGLAALGPPVRAGLDLAIEDINAAGGVLDRDVEVIRGDEAGDAAKVRDATQRLLSEGAQVIHGAMSSGMSDTIIQTLFDNEIPQCSPSNTSNQFAEQENATFYVRTVPSDAAVVPVIADRLVADGHSSIAIAARADDYGRSLSELLEPEAEDVGLTVTANVLYDPEASTFDSEVEQLTEGDPDAIVLVAFAEGATLAAGLLEAGITAEQLYGADGIFDPTLPNAVDPDDDAVLDGMTVIGAAGTEEFLARLAPVTENNLIYGGQAYDCGVLFALAVETVGNLDDGEAIVEAMIQVSKTGEKCTTFADCKELIAAGTDIDYDGASGGIEFDEVGEPTVATYAIAKYADGGTLTVDATFDVDLTEAAG